MVSEVWRAPHHFYTFLFLSKEVTAAEGDSHTPLVSFHTNV